MAKQVIKETSWSIVEEDNITGEVFVTTKDAKKEAKPKKEEVKEKKTDKKED